MGLLNRIENQSSRRSEGLHKCRRQKRRIIAFDEKLMDRVRDSQGDFLRSNGKKGNSAEPAVEAIGADTPSDDFGQLIPELGVRFLLGD
jgi:hypothetical protein